MGRLREFGEIQVGDTAEIVRRVGDEEVRRFVELTGDDNPLHVDPAYAEASAFKDVVVHGMLGASFLSALIGTELPGVGALWISQSLEFLLPVRIGDTLVVSCTVEKKHERERLLELDAKIENQRNAVVLRGKGVVRVLEPPAASPQKEPERSKVAIVSGGAGGIGRAVCRRLAKDGYRVAVAYRQAGDRATAVVREIVAEGGTAIAVQADVTSEREVSALAEMVSRRFSGLSLVVHAAAGPIDPAGFDDVKWEAVQRHIDTQVKGAFLLAKACVPRMRTQGYGKIIVVTSQVLDGAPVARWTAYTVAKAGLAALARSLAVELGPFGIRVNCVSPGMTETGLIADIPEKMRLVLARQTPLRRLGLPEDVAGAVAYLASPEADYVTGETLRVNGGQVTI